MAQQTSLSLVKRYSMELREVFQIIWKRLWLIVLGTLLVSAVTFMASRSMTPIYQAKVTMMVKQSANAPFADLKVFASGENLALTYSKLLKTRPLLETVIANLNLDMSPGKLRDKLGTRLVPETQLLVLTAKDPDPQRAADITNEVAFTFISSHNTEQQLQDIIALEQDVVSQSVNPRQYAHFPWSVK
jgi:capsular polysaccharide biosynthesis protein